MGWDVTIFVFWKLSFKSAFSLSSFTLIKRLHSSSLLFCMMYSAYKLNKQGENIQPWHTAFPILNQSVVPYLVLTIALDLIYRFLRRQEVLLLPYSVVFQKQNQRKMYLYWYRSKLKEKLTQEPCFLTSLNRVVKYLNIYAQTLMGLKSPWNYRKKFVCRLSICCFWWEGIWERDA